MINQNWWAVSLAILSLLLSVSSLWLKNPFRQEPKKRWTGQAAQFFYYVSLPYLALLSGVLPSSLLGLKGLEYFAMISPASDPFAIQHALILILAEWLADARMTILVGLVAIAVWSGVRYMLIRGGVKQTQTLQPTTLDTIYLSLHWAFYRAIFWQISGDLYLGVVLGAALVIMEWVLVAMVQKNWPAHLESILIHSSILILTGAVFFYSPNLWLLWPVHLVMVAIFYKLEAGSIQSPLSHLPNPKI